MVTLIARRAVRRLQNQIVDLSQLVIFKARWTFRLKYLIPAARLDPAIQCGILLVT
jgi:hypothetical protein